MRLFTYYFCCSQTGRGSEAGSLTISSVLRQEDCVDWFTYYFSVLNNRKIMCDWAVRLVRLIFLLFTDRKILCRLGS